jgi:hypothetical protein
MRHVIMLSALTACGVGLAAPVPQDARVLVLGLSDPSQRARDEAVAALTNRPDAAPWLRRTARSSDRDTVRRSAALLAAFAKKRQAVVPAAIEACIKSGRADLFVEWHHFWQPESKDHLWPVGPKAGKPGLDLFAKLSQPGGRDSLERAIGEMYAIPPPDVRTHDGPFATREESGIWRLRTDRIDGDDWIAFASVTGPINTSWVRPGYYFALGDVSAGRLGCALVVSDGGLRGREYDEVVRGPRQVGSGFVACRGDAILPKTEVRNLVLLAGGDIDLSDTDVVQDSTIRAGGEIRLKPGYEPKNCKIEPHAKDATSPYRFFELADVGLFVVDDEEGLVVADLKPGTPFGSSGLKKGDVIQAIGDAPPGHSSEFRKSVRRAMVRQGDCLLTVARGREKLDLPVYFPIPK